MPLDFRAIQSTLKTEDGKNLWYPTLVKHGTIGIKPISKRIAEKSSLTEGDVYNVIRCLLGELNHNLMNGYSVNLDEVGTFTAISKAGGRGVEKPEDVNASQIKTLTIRFTPSYKRTPMQGITRAMYEGVEFRRWSGDPYAPGYKYAAGNTDGGGSDNDDDDYVDPNA